MSYYQGRCIGRVLEFLKAYDIPYDAREYCQVGHGEVIYAGKLYANFVWSNHFGETDVPEFTFLDDPDGRLVENQRHKRIQTVFDLASLIPEGDRIPLEKETLCAIIEPDLFHHVDIYGQLVCQEHPKFFLVGKKLYAQAKDRYWVFNPEHNHRCWYVARG